MPTANVRGTNVSKSIFMDESLVEGVAGAHVSLRFEMLIREQGNYFEQVTTKY
ncbi:hypothetical protein VCHA47P369_30165 [Vibrio chagasii]|nr:hypothetical protein VCHA34P129_10288 [Vibrio chagasii]CAH6847794.1 hypothetical protein VCHA35O135_10316 [Vibrio chagasii]CAH6860699.1 hypothetical protein VCHA34P120_10372 [Vibrio chagasii]CAH6882942.1 hypothetical protein VCHA35O142_20235 [Vibrio chagasii]CAH6896898.1 hypothetical protein VCHA30O60_30121 [Vibrio chagasii]